jgi:DNA processing protein
VERDELYAWLRLSLTPGIGNASARKLLGAFALPGTIFEQSSAALQQVANSAQVAALRSEPPELAALLETTWAWLQASSPIEGKHQVVVLGDPGYPATLLNMDDPPLMLYLLGAGSFAINSIPNDRHIDPAHCLAVVGSRNPTPQGEANARQFSKELAQAGVTVISGLALGVDGAAHEGALEGQSSQTTRAVTVAVVGTGLDRVYPKAHHDLAHRITQTGLIISEYHLGTPPLNANFPKRNRLIAGLAQGTLVVEAALKSGSLITARLSAEQNKDVFAIPGSIHTTQSRGCHALIKQGAKLVETAQDVLEELRGYSAPIFTTDFVAYHADATDACDLFDSNNGLLDALGFDPVGLDALQARTGLNAAEMQAQLMTLELDGRVARLPGGLFQRMANS